MRALMIAGLMVSAPAAGQAAEPAPPPPSSFTVPFELYKGHMYVRAFVNGRGPYRFGFDTGASGMGRADVRLVAEQSLKKVGGTLNSDGVKSAPIDVVAVGSLRLGELERRDVRLLSRDYNKGLSAGREPMMGIVAREFFADRLLTIDYPARTLTFSIGSLSPAEAGTVAYGDGFAIPVCFASGCFPGKVDTGSSQGLVVPMALLPRIKAGPAVHVGSGRRANSVSQMYEMTLAEPVRISGVTANGLKVRYADPSDDEINVGSRFLENYVLTIDPRHRLLRIEAPTEATRGN